MVHQVTGADELLLPPTQQQTEGALLPALPARAAPSTAGGALLLPTLDTSAFLLGGYSARTTGAMPAPTRRDGSLRQTSLAAAAAAADVVSRP
ncbi:hypothetical protein ZWY2020_006718 [Hordeum vulgare]|nr:hypothetical protein ZWY2020_006718 [Hordeum vulgare]